jgi:hypothetical protein
MFHLSSTSKIWHMSTYHDVHYDGAKPQNCVVLKFCTTGGQSLLSLSGTMEKNFSFHFKHYNLIIHAVKCRETFCTCSTSSLVQDPMVKSAKRRKKISFGLLELEMADLERFWRKTPLGPLGVNINFIVLFIMYIILLNP